VSDSSLPHPVNPPELGPHAGFSHAVVAPAGRLVFVAGQVAADGEGRVAGGAFAEQFDRALARTLLAVAAAGGGPEHVARMTVYVTDRAEYQASRARLSEIWRARMGRHFPAMVLVEVASLLEEGAKVEIEATAVLEEGR
jgi:enamine deaminase RidA (YjgF/YER057c/UK114 family)